MILRSPARLMLSLMIAAGLGVPCVAHAALNQGKLRTAATRPAAKTSRGRSAAPRSKASRTTPATRREGRRVVKTGLRRQHVEGVRKTEGSARSSASKGNANPKARSAKRSKRTSKRQKGQMAPTADRISEIQQALAKDGSFSGTPNGKWDDGTVDAVKRFQESHGLNPTGKVDAKTLQQLGLGSSTAGLAPPVPAASSLATPKNAQSASRQTP
jgi:murein L,D-transpeptidase YcbB/YkuD